MRFITIKQPFWGICLSCLPTTEQANLEGHILELPPAPHPVTVTTRIITCLIGNPYKPSFVTVTGWGVDLRHILVCYTSQASTLGDFRIDASIYGGTICLHSGPECRVNVGKQYHSWMTRWWFNIFFGNFHPDHQGDDKI